MKGYYDLHLHSCLSPCGDGDMTINNIVGMAVLKELNFIALTDHNTTRNCPAFLKVAKEHGICAVPGMELTTAEEIHIVCLFQQLEDALSFSEYVEERLPAIQNNPDIFGEQIMLNDLDEPIGTVDKLLINATEISIEQVPELMRQFHGLAFPAHIDKSSYSVISAFGYLPEEYNFSCYEVKQLQKLESLKKQNPVLEQAVIISNSDAHYLEHINEQEHFLEVDAFTSEALFRALSQK